MDIKPLNKELHEKLVAAGIQSFDLEFSGGGDEGYLNVSTNPSNDNLESEIETWAWNVYSYSGAGDGSGDYGDDITYNLKNKTVSHQGWQHEPIKGDLTEGELKIG